MNNCRSEWNGSASAAALPATGALGLDNFNDYYPVALKRARQALAASNGVYIADGDITDAALLAKLFGLCEFTHVLHLAAQVRKGRGAKHLDVNNYTRKRWSCAACRVQVLLMLTRSHVDRSPCADLPSLTWQAGVRYATRNPYSYVHANVAGHVTLLEAIRVS